MRRGLHFVAVLTLAYSSSALGGVVWESTFDVDGATDGVVDIFIGNDTGGGLAKDMIDPSGASGGALQIITQDDAGSVLPDKAGRPLGGIQDWNTSMSAKVDFQWSAFTSTSNTNANTSQFFGFIGGPAVPGADGHRTRQALGVKVKQWWTGSLVRMSFSLYAVSSSNTSNVNVNANIGSIGSFTLGDTSDATDPTNKNFSIIVEFDGTTHTLAARLLDENGALVSGHSGIDLDTIANVQDPDWEPDFGVDHLGWSDFAAAANNETLVWQVDSMKYYDTALVPEPASLALMGLASLVTCCRRRY